MKSLLKFISWAVIGVMGITLGNFWFSWAGELVTTKNSFAVAGGLLMIGVGLGAALWALFTVIMRLVGAFLRWDPTANKESCCQNECGCDRSDKPKFRPKRTLE